MRALIARSSTIDEHLAAIIALAARRQIYAGAGLARSCLSLLVRVGRDALSRPPGSGRGAERRRCPRQPLVQSLRRARRTALRAALAFCRVTHRLERDRAGLHALGGAADLL